MARRPVYVPFGKAPLADVFMPEFAWSGGFAVSQRQKNITALHEAFHRDFPDSNILEISSKSMQPLGVKLSAFNLTKYVPTLGRSVPVECVFQGGKTFSEGGPFTDLFEVTAREAKRDTRLKESGRLTCFFFVGEVFPLSPKTAFYNWLYINALAEHPDLAEQLVCYDAFTDIEFNPEKSINCQANAAAVFVALHRRGQLEECRDFTSYLKLIS